MINTPEQPPVEQRDEPRYLRLPTTRPVWTYILLGSIVVVFLAGVAADVLAGGDAVTAVTRGSQAFLNYGAKVNAALLAGEYWRFITPVFLHVGIIHILFNGYFLYVMGPQLEAVFGYGRFLLIYFAAGIWGVIFSLAFSDRPSAGASGALFGILGALAVFFYVNRRGFGLAGQSQLRSILTVAGLNLLIGLTPGIDNWGHIGGMAGGALLAWLIGPRYASALDQIGRPIVIDTRSPYTTLPWAGGFYLATAALAVVALRMAAR
mgnify:CR=1 FL=1